MHSLTDDEPAISNIMTSYFMYIYGTPLHVDGYNNKIAGGMHAHVNQVERFYVMVMM